LLRVDRVTCGLINVLYCLGRYLVGFALDSMLERQLIRLIVLLLALHVVRVSVDRSDTLLARAKVTLVSLGRGDGALLRDFAGAGRALPLR